MLQPVLRFLVCSDVHYLDEPNMKIAAKYRSDADVRKVEDWEELQNQKYLDEGACYVRLEGVNPKLMADVPEAQANAIFAHTDAVRNIMRKASREKHCQWLIAMIPTQEWAEFILKDVPKEQALDELWKLLLKLILAALPYAAVASVRGQVFAGGTTWHLVQYNGMWGYVRADQMRMMSEEEVQSYLQSLEKGTPLPTEVPYTPAPITQESLSSYGHVQSNSGKVNMRSEPSTEATRLKLLDNYAFALVMGSETGADGKTWYKVSQAGTEGYIQGDYFKVLTLSELTRFLQSNEYKAADDQLQITQDAMDHFELEMRISTMPLSELTPETDLKSIRFYVAYFVDYGKSGWKAVDREIIRQIISSDEFKSYMNKK